jgi:hypothetical protein
VEPAARLTTDVSSGWGREEEPKSGPDATLFGNTEMSYLRSSNRKFSEGEEGQFWGMPGGRGGAWASGGPKLWPGGWRWHHCPCCCSWRQVWAWA